MDKCFLNGEVMPLSEATISPLDRGFLFGDGVYEVIPVYSRKLFCWSRHARRLARNLAEIQIDYDVEALLSPAESLIADAGESELSLYIQITRGVGAKRAHAFPQPPLSPTVFMLATPRPLIAEEKRRDGVACHTMKEFRWRRADIKAVSLLGAVLAAQQAAERGDEEVILLRDGIVGEAAVCNVFVVSGGTLRTPKADERILPGITREVVLELARGENIPVLEDDITRAELASADEIWLSSSTREILPVTSLDGAPVGEGKPGEVYELVAGAFRRFVESGA